MWCGCGLLSEAHTFDFITRFLIVGGEGESQNKGKGVRSDRELNVCVCLLLVRAKAKRKGNSSKRVPRVLAWML